MDTTDRCNDAQDEIVDLREQIAAYKEALAHAAAAAGAARAADATDAKGVSPPASTSTSRPTSVSPQQQQLLDKPGGRAGLDAPPVRAQLPVKLPPVSATAVTPAAATTISLPPITQSASAPAGIGGAKKAAAPETLVVKKLPPQQAAHQTPGEAYEEDFDEEYDNEFEED